MSASSCVSRLAVLVAVAVLGGVASVGATPAAPSSAAGPSVQSMIVGTGGSILSRAQTVTAGATTLQVGGKRCAVAAGTPLSVLAAVRNRRGPAFALRDYGRCGSSPVNSGQLFVYSLGGERNRGQSGWEYKVGHVSGSTGAADPSGPRGDGRRLRSGAHLLWFWCNASAGGCQRTLDVAPSAVSVNRGGSIGVTVTGYDNEGRGTPAVGAVATLGSDFASTGTHGEATLIAPSTPGRYSLNASRPGLVPSFPETIVVR
ncbi:MAG TPA: hypothetical protein VNZ01_14450 [Solirubrobacteraceae bacterium]|jgi:hypothetical protein|nr:hypothetical protein [Solirubrobacteraceae bacterium]